MYHIPKLGDGVGNASPSEHQSATSARRGDKEAKRATRSRRAAGSRGRSPTVGRAEEVRGPREQDERRTDERTHPGCRKSAGYCGTYSEDRST